MLTTQHQSIAQKQRKSKISWHNTIYTAVGARSEAGHDKTSHTWLRYEKMIYVIRVEKRRKFVFSFPLIKSQSHLLHSLHRRRHQRNTCALTISWPSSLLPTKCRTENPNKFSTKLLPILDSMHYSLIYMNGFGGAHRMPALCHANLVSHQSQ